MKHTIRFANHFSLDFPTSLYSQRWCMLFARWLKGSIARGEELDPHADFDPDSPEARGRRFALQLRIYCSIHIINVNELVDKMSLICVDSNGNRQRIYDECNMRVSKNSEMAAIHAN